MGKELAIYGGAPALRTEEVKNWPPIDAIDEKLVMEALHQTNQSRGPQNLAFEKEFAAWNGNQYALFTNSGTAALHMCLVGCGIGAGDHVLVTAYTWSSSATCILHHDAIPIFVDIDPETFLMDPDKIEAAITPRTKAVIVVQLHGLCDDMDKINAIAKKHNLAVIEDACQAHGALYKGKKAGTLGHCAAFSLNQNKCLCAGEGGVFVTDDPKIYENASKLWSFGETARPEQSRDYHAYALGWMYRNNEITAAFARAQLSKYDYYFKTCCANGNYLAENLKGIKGLLLPYVPEDCVHNWYNFNLRIDFNAIGFNGGEQDKIRFRDAVAAAVAAEGIRAAVWQRFILPEMTVFQAKNAYGHGYPWSIPGADEGVDYTPSRFPCALEYSHKHISVVQTLRAPNGLDIAEKAAEGIQKVFTNLDKIDVERIETICKAKK
ncbi:MAG: L-glutamine:2-deoxy-scyllo-inosose aminotransferase [Lentisphaerae bacterium ADurb.Bin242]|nr:MAG: L-glutamine:2-deoxy-scyllo-inosose aminotransferase [Lentisphaerae bacterium ADurb.Bin242]